MLSKARKWASISVGAPLLGNMDGSFFLRAFLLQEFLLVFYTYVNALWMSLSLHRCPTGEPRGGSFAGTFERKEVVYLGSFLGPRGY